MHRFFGLGARAAVVALIIGLSAGAYAFTAQNSVPSSVAGLGSNTISGVTVTAIHYNVNGADPTVFDSANLTLSAALAAAAAHRDRRGTPPALSRGRWARG